MFRKRAGLLKLYILCFRDGRTCRIYFVLMCTPSSNICSGLFLWSEQNSHAFTHSSLSLSLILPSRNFQIKYALTFAVRKTQLKYTLCHLTNKLANFLLNSLFRVVWTFETRTPNIRNVSYSFKNFTKVTLQIENFIWVPNYQRIRLLRKK